MLSANTSAIKSVRSHGLKQKDIFNRDHRFMYRVGKNVLKRRENLRNSRFIGLEQFQTRIQVPEKYNTMFIKVRTSYLLKNQIAKLHNLSILALNENSHVV